MMRNRVDVRSTKLREENVLGVKVYRLSMNFRVNDEYVTEETTFHSKPTKAIENGEVWRVKGLLEYGDNE